MIELTGRRLGVDSRTASDYEAFRDGAALVDLSARGRMRFSGAGARDALNGVLTCDVAPLANGGGAYGAALTSKGKVVADVTVFAAADSFLVESSPAASPGWEQLVAKYINPRLAARTNETDTTFSIGLFGPEAPKIVAAVTGVDAGTLEALAVYSHVTAVSEGAQVNVARIPDMGVDGFRIVAARANMDTLTRNVLSEGARAV